MRSSWSDNTKKQKRSVLQNKWIMFVFLCILLSQVASEKLKPETMYEQVLLALGSKQNSVKSFYSAHCQALPVSGDYRFGWWQTEKAQGRPDLLPSAEIIDFDYTNSAFYKGGNFSIVCGEFLSENEGVDDSAGTGQPVVDSGQSSVMPIKTEYSASSSDDTMFPAASENFFAPATNTPPESVFDENSTGILITEINEGKEVEVFETKFPEEVIIENQGRQEQESIMGEIKQSLDQTLSFFVQPLSSLRVNAQSIYDNIINNDIQSVRLGLSISAIKISSSSFEEISASTTSKNERAEEPLREKSNYFLEENKAPYQEEEIVEIINEADNVQEVIINNSNEEDDTSINIEIMEEIKDPTDQEVVGKNSSKDKFIKEAKAQEVASREMIVVWYQIDDGSDNPLWQVLDTIPAELLLNKKNNEYLYYELKNINQWSDIKDIRFKLEGKYDLDNDVVAYLDSIWLEAEYESGISERDIELSNQKESEKILEADGLDFSFTDDNSGENLIIRTNEKLYIGITSADVYFSVTNVGAGLERINVQAYFPSDQGELINIERLVGKKWKAAKLQAKSISYRTTILNKIFGREIKRKEVPAEFNSNKSTEETNQVLYPGQTAYYKMKIKFPVKSSGEFYIEAIGDKRGYGLLDPWWSSSWQYKNQITIDNQQGSSTLSDFQVRVEIDNTETEFWNHVASDGADVRFLNAAETDELDFYQLYFDYTASSAIYWVKVDTIPAAATTSIYLYYKSIGASSVSSAEDTFSYSSGEPRYVAMGDFIPNNNAYAITFFDDNNIGIGGYSDSDWDTGSSENVKNISSSYISDGVVATSTKPFAITGHVGGGEMWSPISWQSTLFVTTSWRDDINFYLYNPTEATSTVDLYRNGSVGTPFTLAPGEYREETSLTFVADDHWRVSSTMPILLFQAGGSTGNYRDNIPVPPPALEWNGIVRNTRVICSENGTSYTLYYSDSTFANGTCNKSEVDVIAKAGGTYGSGPSARLVSDKPVYVWSSADGNGYDQQTWFSDEDIDNEYLVTETYTYLACSAPYDSTIITVYNMSGIQQATSGNLGTNGVYPHHWRDNNTRSGGMRVISNKPVYCYYDQNPGSEGEDEFTTQNIVVNRKGAWPRPLVSLGTEIEADEPRLSQNYYRWFANENTKEIGAVFAEQNSYLATTSITDYVSLVTATSTLFQPNSKYLVYVNAGLAAGAGLDNRTDYEIRYGASPIYTGLVEPPGDAQDAFQISWFDLITTGASPQDISLHFKVNNAGTSYGFNAQILALNLEDLDQKDWKYASNTVSATHSASMEEKASITLDQADGAKDWLILATEEVGINDTSVRVQAEIYDGSTSTMAMSQEGEDEEEEWSYVLMRAFQDVETDREFSLRIQDSAAGINTHNESRIIALNLDVFKNYKYVYQNISTGISDSSWTEIGNLNSGGNYQPVIGGQQIVLASFINQVGSASAGTDYRLLINNSTSSPEWSWQQSFIENKTARDALDKTLNNVVSFTYFPDTGYPIGLEATEVNSINQIADEVSMIVFSTLLTSTTTSELTPNNPWPLIDGDILENTPIATSSVGRGDVLRLRISLLGSRTDSEAGSVDFKLQHGKNQDCSAISSWEDVGQIASSSIWRGYNNSGLNDESIITETVLSVSDVGGSYEEENSSTSTPNDIKVGEDGEWDWVLENNGADAGEYYCFRMVKSDGSTLFDYYRYPQVYTNQAALSPTTTKMFDNEKTGNTTPVFEFYALDPNGDDLLYEIQWSEEYDFTSSTTRRSDVHAGFVNKDNGSDLSPFNSGENISFTVQAGDSLQNNTTYWWRVRAKDPEGNDDWGGWSEAKSFTVDTGVSASSWHQTTDEQFERGIFDIYTVLSGFGQVVMDPTIGEYGTSTLSGEATSTINLHFNYTDPIVVASPRYNWGNARSIRITRKDSSSFDVFVDDYGNGISGLNTGIDWLVMEAGAWTIENGATGIKVIAGSKNVSAIGGTFGAVSWDSPEVVSFSPNFDATPIVLHSISSYTDTSWITSHVDDGVGYNGDPSASQMGLILNHSKTPNTGHGPEDIDYIAFDTGNGSNNNITFNILKSGDTIAGIWNTPPYNTSYGSVFSSPPGVELSAQLGEDGGDGGWSIYFGTFASSSSSNYPAAIDEANSTTDRQHTTEPIGIVAFDSNGPGYIVVYDIGTSTYTGPAINYSDGVNVAGWKQVYWNDDETYGQIIYQIEYYNGSIWQLIPDVALAGNSAGFGDSPIDISNLNIISYDIIRLKAIFSYAGDTPILDDWTVEWKEPIRFYGTVYSDEGQTEILTEPVVVLVIDGNVIASTTASSTDGSFEFVYDGWIDTGSSTMVYLDGGSERGAHFNKYAGNGNVVNFDIYQNHIILRHDDSGPITNVEISDFDNSNDNDIKAGVLGSNFSASSSQRVYIWPNCTFRPGGTVTLSPGETAASIGGDLKIASSSTFDPQFNTISIGGDFINNGFYTPGVGQFTNFIATSSGFSIFISTSTFTNLVFNGSGGEWQMSTTTVINGNLSMTAGTLTGTVDIIVYGGSATGNGVINLSNGTFLLDGNGNFGGNSDWNFYNLNFGDGSSLATSTKEGTGQITVNSILIIDNLQALRASSSLWTLVSSSNPVQVNGNFVPDESTFRFKGALATNIPALTYYNLELIPSGGGSPVFTIGSGNFITNNYFFIGDGTNGVYVNASSNDPVIDVNGDFEIRNNSIFIASQNENMSIGGTWINNGTFEANSGRVVFDAGTIGKIIDAGNSAFHNIEFNNPDGGWTIYDHASSTGDWTIATATSFIASSSIFIESKGAFTNNVADDVTDWNSATLYINSTSTNPHVINEKIYGDVYYRLVIGSSTHVMAWNSTSSQYQVDPAGSLYSMDHNGQKGWLYIWGNYLKSTSTDYWSYETDFDGADLTGIERQCNVRFAANASSTYEGGGLEIKGLDTATTTIASFDSADFSLVINNGELNAEYYQIRDIEKRGIVLDGASNIDSLDFGDYLLAIDGGSIITLASTTVDYNSAKTISGCVIASSTGVSGYNVNLLGTSGSYWQFINYQGNLAGEAFDNDYGGICGGVRWDDSGCTDIVLKHYRWRKDDDSEILASWKATEDTAIVDQNINENLRIRFSIDNIGSGAANNDTYRLKIASKGVYSTCTSVPSIAYSFVPTTTLASPVAVMATSSNFYDQDPSTAQLTSEGTFTPGLMVQTPNNKAINQSLNVGQYSELEYNFKFTDNAVLNRTYCLRIAQNDVDLSAYAKIAQVKIVGVSVSGNAYEDENSTVWSGCNGTTQNISLVINGSFIASTSCSALDGAYSFSNVDFSAGDGLSVFFNKNGGNSDKGATVTVAANNYTNISLYLRKNIVWLETETGISSITNTHLGHCDSSAPTECDQVPYEVISGDISVESRARVIIAPGKTYQPGGVLTINNGELASSTGSDLVISPGATLNIESNDMNLGGDFSNYGVFTRTLGQVTTFTATSTGFTIRAGSYDFADVVFNGSNGNWQFTDDTTIDGDLTLTDGTLTGTSSITVNGGDVTGDGVINLSDGIFTLDSSGNFGGNNDWIFNSLEFGDGLWTANTYKIGSNNIVVNSILSIQNSQVLHASNSDWLLNGDSVPFQINGTFVADTSTFKFRSTSDASIWAASYYSLGLIPDGAGNPSYTLLSGTLAVENHLYIGDGINTVAVTAAGQNPSLDINGDIEIRAQASLTSSASAVFTVAGNWTDSGQFIHNNNTVIFDAVATGTVITASSTFYNIDFNSTTGGWIIPKSITAENDFSLTQAAEFIASSSHAWYLSDWPKRKEIIIDADQVTENLSDFPVLISIIDADIASSAQDNGDDILFTAGDGITKLDHEIEKFSTTTNELVVWVKAESLSSTTDTILFVYYGNSGAINQENPTEVWSNNFDAVWHLKEIPDGSNDEILDSTGNGYDGTTYTMDSADQISAQIDGGLDFDGTSDYIALDMYYDTAGAIAELSACTWFNTSFVGASYTDNWSFLDFDRSEYFNFYLRGDTGTLEFSTTRSGTQDDFVANTSGLNDGNWHYACAVYDGTIKYIYLDGDLDGTNPSPAHGAGGLGSGVVRYAFIGDGSEATAFNGTRNNFWYEGVIDELQYGEDVKSAGWIKTSFNNQSSSTNFIKSISVEENYTPGAHVTFEVQGEFSNSISASSTTWDGSTLYLNGSDQTINSKDSDGDAYYILKISANTDVKIWNSSANLYIVDSNGSLYSMDHAGSDGELYIWGKYERDQGVEYWNRSIDFNGDSIAGAGRQCQVKIDAGASVKISGAQLQMIGNFSSQTEISSQGSGSYSLEVSDGSINSQYYKIYNTDSDGLNLTGTTTISSLDQGDFKLSSEGGSMITIASSVVSANDNKIITGCQFEKEAEVESGYNVSVPTVASGHIIFTAHTGDYDGEDYDNDPGDPRGYIIWDDSPDYTPKSQNWRWYHDQENETPLESAAGENITANLIGQSNILKLRMSIAETEDLDGQDVKMRLQYSTYSDFSSDVNFVGETGSSTAVWNYGDGVDSDNDAVTSLVLTDSVLKGTHNESGISTSTFDHASSSIVEWEFTIYNNGASTSTTYYFRVSASYFSVYDTFSKAVTTNTGESYPSLVVSPGTLTLSIEGLPIGTSTEGIITDASSTVSSVNFGTLSLLRETEAAQRFVITTDAENGYQLFVFSNQNLVAANGAIINSVNANNEIPAAWPGNPDPGAFGYHTGDDTLSGASAARFAPDNTYAKFETSMKEISYSGIPVVNQKIDMVYKVEVNNMQSAGEYETELSYIVVPVY